MFIFPDIYKMAIMTASWKMHTSSIAMPHTQPIPSLCQNEAGAFGNGVNRIKKYAKGFVI
jgi:hypothetical protein